MKIIVLLNGERTKDLVKYISESDIVLCADGGANPLYMYGIVPKLIIGDMDSIGPIEKSWFEKKGTEFKTYPCEKDETDGQLIIEEAIKMRPDEIVILGGGGGRTDHFFGNIQLMYRVAKHGIFVMLAGEKEDILLVTRDISIPKNQGKLVSLIPYEDTTILTLSGFKYNVENFEFRKDTPIGISNYIVDNMGKVQVHRGAVVIFIEKIME